MATWIIIKLTFLILISVVSCLANFHVKTSVAIVATDGVDPVSGVCSDNLDEENQGSEGVNHQQFQQLLKGFLYLLNAVTSESFNTSSSVVHVDAECDDSAADFIMQNIMDIKETQTITGVITITRGHTARVVASVVRYFSVPIVEIVSGDIVMSTSSGPNHYIVPHYTYWQIQNALFAASIYNWTALALAELDLNTRINSITREIFKRLAFENGICSLPVYFKSDAPVLMFYPDSNDSMKLDYTDSRIVLIVGENTMSTTQKNLMMSDTSHLVLHLHPVSPEWPRLTEAIKNTCNSTSINNQSRTNVSNEYHNLCLSVSDLTFGMRTYFHNVLRSISFVMNLSETPLDKPSCNISNTSLSCLLLESDVTTLDTNSKFLYTMSKLFQIQFLNNSIDNEYISKQEEHYTLLVPANMSSAIVNKDCGSVCNKCMQCFPSKSSKSKLLTSGHSDVYIVGFFPVHRSSQEGLCDEPNPVGYSAALTFIDTVRSLWNKFRISGVVFDSCGSLNEVIYIVNSLDTCAVYFTEEVNEVQISRSFDSSSILGYVNGGNSFHLPSDVSDKVVLSLQDWGYSTSADLQQVFVDNVLKGLFAIGWTVVNIIVTDQEPFRALAQLVKSSPVAKSFCFVHEIIIPSVSTHTPHEFDRIVVSMNKTPVYFLLTNSEDTGQIFQHFQFNTNKITTKISFILTPINRAIYQVADVSAFADFIITFRLAGNNVSRGRLESINSTLQRAQTAWSREFPNISSSTFTSLDDLAWAIQATQEFLSLLENNYIFRSESTLRSTGLDMTAVNVRDNYEKLIAIVDNDLTQIETFDGPSFNMCRGWCPVCHACNVKEIARQTNLYLDGDVQITGVFPLHNEGEHPFSCGAAQINSVKLLKIKSFMFAVESFQTRYPGLLPGLKVGGLVLDSCSSSVIGLKTIVDFQTRALNFACPKIAINEEASNSKQNNKLSNPSKNLAFIIDAGDKDTDYIKRGLEMSKFQNNFFVSDINSLSMTATLGEQWTDFSNITLQILMTLGWDKVIIISEKLPEFQREVKLFFTEAEKINICAIAVMYFNTLDLFSAGSHLEQYRGMPVVLLSSKQTAEVVFDSLKTIKNSYFWIISASHDSWRHLPTITDHFPLGSIFIDFNFQQNEHFDSFLHNLSSDPRFTLSLSPWFKDLWRLQYSCYFSADRVHGPEAKIECPHTTPVPDIQIKSPVVYSVIRSVDAILHYVHFEYKEKCPFMAGICDQFAESIANRRLSIIPGARVGSQWERLENIFDGQSVSSFSVMNFQKDGFVQVGSYSRFALSLNVTKIRFYTALDLELNQIPRMVCVTDCHCLDISSDNDTFLTGTNADLYRRTHAEFIHELWAMIVLAIGCFGALLSLIFAVYVVFKVSKRALGKRYIGLGLTLLFSLMLLFLTILPFVFTQSEPICGLRYFLPGLSYTLCFAVILVKLMSLQSYKLIGLGGELSGVNQFLTVFFIVSVQVAIGVQRWFFSKPTADSFRDSLDVKRQACSFSREDFAAYHVYVMLLIVICFFYSIGVRKEKKNMGEAKLLLACSCSCLVIWLIWFPCFFLLDRKWSDVIICTAILACATATLVTIFVPKIRMVSRLKYDVTQKSNFRNGHSVDTDFLYERPYSLPGTLTSTFSSGKMNYPKTFTHFDADVNY